MEGTAAPSAHDYVEAKQISIKNHPELNEKWVQDLLAKNPSILGLGDLFYLNRELLVPGGGKLDLLFARGDEEDQVWFEVEVQLGATDPSHIIRTIEYWDLVRTRHEFPQRKHIAVLVAEDITSRFLNVISLLNKTVPIMAIQMQAIQVETHLTLVFTTVVDTPRQDEDAAEALEVADRPYWEKKAKTVLPIVDKIFAFVQKQAPGFDLRYNLDYIRISKDGRNLISVRPKKARTRIRIRMRGTADSEDLKAQIAGPELEVTYEETGKGGASYIVNVDNNSLEKHLAPIEKLIALGLTESNE